MLSDCRSLVANLNTEVPSRVQDERLQIELDAMRQSIFDGDGRRTAEVYPKGGDRVDVENPALEATPLYLTDREHSSRPRPSLQP